MAHGTPVGIAENDERYGMQGAFLIEAGISSSYHIANFFGLTEWIRQPQEAATPVPKRATQKKPRAPTESASAKLIPLASPISASGPDLAKVLWPLNAKKQPPKPQT